MLDKVKTIVHKPWSPLELTVLKRMVESGATRKQISDSMGRSYYAVKSKIDTLRIQKPLVKHPDPHVTLTVRVTSKFHHRYRSFCRHRAANFGDTIEVVMDAFMNQVIEDEQADKHRR